MLEAAHASTDEDEHRLQRWYGMAELVQQVDIVKCVQGEGPRIAARPPPSHRALTAPQLEHMRVDFPGFHSGGEAGEAGGTAGRPVGLDAHHSSGVVRGEGGGAWLGAGRSSVGEGGSLLHSSAPAKGKLSSEEASALCDATASTPVQQCKEARCLLVLYMRTLSPLPVLRPPVAMCSLPNAEFPPSPASPRRPVFSEH